MQQMTFQNFHVTVFRYFQCFFYKQKIFDIHRDICFKYNLCVKLNNNFGNLKTSPLKIHRSLCPFNYMHFIKDAHSAQKHVINIAFIVLELIIRPICKSTTQLCSDIAVVLTKIRQS